MCIRDRVGVVYAINILTHKDYVRADFSRTDCRRGVGRDERDAETSAQNDDSALLEMRDRAVTDIGLSLIHISSLSDSVEIRSKSL